MKDGAPVSLHIALLVSAQLTAHPWTSLRWGVRGCEQQVCGMWLGSVESRFMCVKVPHVGTNTSNSVEDVGRGGVCSGGMRFWRMFLSLQYGNFMGLPQTIFHLLVSYRGSDGSEGRSLSELVNTTQRHIRGKKPRFSPNSLFSRNMSSRV